MDTDVAFFTETSCMQRGTDDQNDGERVYIFVGTIFLSDGCTDMIGYSEKHNILRVYLSILCF